MVKFKKEFSYIGGRFELDTEYRSKWFDGYLLIYMFDEGNEEHVRFNQLDIKKYIDENDAKYIMRSIKEWYKYETFEEYWEEWLTDKMREDFMYEINNGGITLIEFKNYWNECKEIYLNNEALFDMIKGSIYTGK